MTKILTKNHADLKITVQEHLDADALVKGTYWEDGKGCFIGCLAHSANPMDNERKYGLPVSLQRVAENIFESLPEGEGRDFFSRLPAAVGRNGKDLTKVVWKFLAAELRELPEVDEQTQASIDQVIKGMDLLASGKAGAAEVAEVAWWPAEALRPAAEAAARAREAATWAAAGATWAAARAAAEVAEVAWWAAADAERAASRTAARIRQKETLLRLIKEA